jgi:hypothetical protein
MIFFPLCVHISPPLTMPPPYIFVSLSQTVFLKKRLKREDVIECRPFPDGEALGKHPAGQPETIRAETILL